MSKIDLYRAKFIHMNSEERALFTKFNAGKKLNKQELKQLEKLDKMWDWSDYDFQLLDEEEEMMYIADYNPAWWDKVRLIDNVTLQMMERKKQLEIAREKCKEREFREVEEAKHWNNKELREFFKDIIPPRQQLILDKIIKKHKENRLLKTTINFYAEDFEKTKILAEKLWVSQQAFIRDFLNENLKML